LAGPWGVGETECDRGQVQVQLAVFDQDTTAAADIEILSGQTMPQEVAPQPESAEQLRRSTYGARTPQGGVGASDARYSQATVGPRPDGVAQLPFFPDGLLGSTSGEPGGVSRSDQGSPITLHVDDVEVRKALEMLSRDGSLNILVSPNVTGRVTANLRELSVDEALNSILKLCNLVAHRENDLIFVYTPQEVPQSDRILRAFPLDFVSAEDVTQGVEGLLSPTGQAFVTQSSPTDNRKTREVIVAEDLPVHLERIEAYLAQIDRPPRQVLVEVHVLQVELDDETKHGVNFHHVFELMGNTVNLQVEGFATPIGPSSRGFYLDLDGANLDALIECLKSTTDAKTLASPRVLVLNGQKASIQIGERLGYRVTRVTETAAIEDIEFLDVGVVLEVTPRISRNNEVVMHVAPKVSSGEVNDDLPEEETTELETDVLLTDGRGLVIGGLIQEKDSNVQDKVPWLGDLWLAGKLFQWQHLEKTRSEIIVTLLPRVLPYRPEYEVQHEVETSRAATPLLEGPLNRYPRPWEPSLPDSVRNPRVIRLPCTHGPACRCRACSAPDGFRCR